VAASAPARLLLPAVATLTLGLAPYLPEPHVVEKLRWLATGQPFRPIDVFDLALHAAPWIWLGWTTARVLRDRRRR
jgi:hypothetical protein